MSNPIDLEEYESDVRVRPLQITDYEALVELQEKCFPGMQPWGRDQIVSQIKHFPEGQIVVEIDGQIAASSSSLILTYEPGLAWHNWSAVADGGYIRNHEPEGDTLYGIEIMVDPEFRGMRLSRRLYDARKELCRERNIERIIIAGRMPGYHKHADKLSAHEYVDRVFSKDLFDPVLTAQLSNGFALQGLISNYLPSDKESCGYATFLEWRNLEHRERAGDRSRMRQLVAPARVAVVQYQMRPIDSFDEFARQCTYFIDTASDYRADFLLFPELFTTQLLAIASKSRPEKAARALAEYTPQYLELMADAALKYNLNIIAGSQLVYEEGELLNIAYFFGRDGAIERQEKIHITPAERKWWGVAPGHGVNVFETDRGKIAMLICYDVEFPELCRVAVQRGAQMIFVPYNTDSVAGHLRVNNCAMARCIENQIYVATAGCCGNLPFVENADIHYAQSAVYTPADVGFPRDAIAAQCTANVETIVMADLDFEKLRRIRHQGSVQNWNDRRTDMYRVHYEDEDGVVDV